MPNPSKGLRAANVYSLILLGIGCLLLLSTALVQAEVLASRDPVSLVPGKGTTFPGADIVYDPTGGLILKRYLIGVVYLVCGLAAHAWMRKNRKDVTTTAAA